MSAQKVQGHWAAIAEVGSAQGILILFWIYKLLGRLPFQIALAPVAAYFFVFNPRQRRASREFLTRCRAMAGLSRPAGAWSIVRHGTSYPHGLPVCNKRAAIPP